MTLALHLNIFDYEDLSFRKEFNRRLYFLGLKNGDPIIRLARDDVLTPKRLYYIALCDAYMVKLSPRTTVTYKGQLARQIRNALAFRVGMRVDEALKEAVGGVENVRDS